MAENKMKKVAKLLDIELNKPFKIKNYETELILKENGLFTVSGKKVNFIIIELLIGKMEIEKTVLDDVEKSYLENVLRPFKDDVIYVKKTLNHNCEHIIYKVKTFYGYNFYSFPGFKKNTMYKGMDRNKEYSLKELRLFEVG